MNARLVLALSSFVVACSAASVAPLSKDGTGSSPGRTGVPSEATADPAGTSTTAPPAAGPNGTIRLSADQRLRADRLTSVFENGTIDLQYDYVEALGDGRGYTIGRGFTTATGDAYRVVNEYVMGAPGDALATFVPELKRLADEESGVTTGLAGFPTAWQNAAKTAGMKTSEDHEVDRASYTPATVLADSIGAKSALTLTVLFDTVFMHGSDEDPDGAPALVTAATAAAGGTPKTGVDEKVWLQKFLVVLRADLANASDPETRVVWAEAVGRADALKDIFDAGNMDLKGPITVGRGYDVTVP